MSVVIQTCDYERSCTSSKFYMQHTHPDPPPLQGEGIIFLPSQNGREPNKYLYIRTKSEDPGETDPFPVNILCREGNNAAYFMGLTPQRRR
ncbi:MAG: hypothetical protein NTZ78_13400 [Candidatus Aureabacteria bacterium]|nr:hypothetical protein [Candidatus Auribacterota bacterium]